MSGQNDIMVIGTNSAHAARSFWGGNLRTDAVNSSFTIITIPFAQLCHLPGWLVMGNSKKIMVVFGMTVAVALASCGTGDRLPPTAYGYFEDYKTEIHFRAMATTAPSSRGGWASGTARGHGNIEDAIEEAMKHCEQGRKKHWTASSCKLYAIGDIVVSGMSDDDLEAAMAFYQTNIDADNDEFDALVLNSLPYGSANQLSETEIRAKIIGNTMTEFSTRQGTQWTELYLQDGTIEGVYFGDRGFIAEWHLDGSRMCWDYSPGTQFDGCWSLALNGDEVVFYEDKKAVGRAQLLQGNPKGL